MSGFALKFSRPNFDRCQHILSIYRSSKINTPHQQIHRFLGRFDRASVRSQLHFKPLQEMMLELTPKISSDIFIKKTPHMLSCTTSMFASLNIYSQVWMETSTKIMLSWINDGRDISIEELFQVYQAHIELNQHKEPSFISLLRTKIKEKLVAEIQDIISSQKLEGPYVQRRFELMHRYIRTILMDMESSGSFLSQVFKVFDRLLGVMNATTSFNISPRYHYNNSSASYELCKALGIAFPDGIYQSTLARMYDQKIKAAKPALQTLRKGESVFENRFQKWLLLNGYQFEGNVRVGLSEFDVLVKGKNRRLFRPLQNLDLERLKQGNFTQITDQQVRQFEEMYGLWYIGEKKQLQEKVVMNLNGPYHNIVGDKSGVVRSETIKEDILRYYGYKKFIQIDYRQWQVRSQNKRAITQYLESILKL